MGNSLFYVRKKAWYHSEEYCISKEARGHVGTGPGKQLCWCQGIAMCKLPIEICHTRPSPCLVHHTLDVNFSLGPQTYLRAHFQRELAAWMCHPSCSDAKRCKFRAVFYHVSRQDLLLGDTVTNDLHEEAHMVKHRTVKTPFVSTGSGC